MNPNIEHQYLKLLDDILRNGVEKKDRTGTGTRSVFGRQIRHKMSEGFPLLTTKKMAFKTMVTELLWFLRGDTNIKYLVDNGCNIWNGDAYKRYVNHWNTPIDDINYDLYSRLDLHPDRRLYTKEEFVERIKTIDEFAKTWGELGPIYGKQWRSWDKFQITNYNGVRTIDQIQNLINDLKTNPDSRRLMVNAWNVGELDQMTLPPCHFSFQCYSHEKEGKRYLSLAWNQRSIDFGLGLPFNIASYGLLLEIIAKEVGMIPYELIGNLGDCHIYSNHIDGLKEQLTRELFPLPKLNIKDKQVSDISEYEVDDFELIDYHYHPSIKLPLSN